MNELILKDVSKYYLDSKNNTGIAALNHVNLTLPLHKITLIHGPSGCGKTTLLKVIAGLYEIDAGQLIYQDLNISHIPPNERNFSLVTQSTLLYPHMTIFDNIAYPLKQASVPPDEIKRRVYELSNLLGIEWLLSRKPKVLSSGQQQMIAIARAIIKQPNVLLLDEPFSNLDPISTKTMMNLIQTIQQKLRLTIVLVTHQIMDSTHFGDLFVTMENGQILETKHRVSTDD